MPKLKLHIFITILICSTTYALASEEEINKSILGSNKYIQFNTGSNINTIKFSSNNLGSKSDNAGSSASIGLGFGADISDGIRGDLMLYYDPVKNYSMQINNDSYEMTSVEITTLMLNITYDVQSMKDYILVPYVSAGFGIWNSSISKMVVDSVIYNVDNDKIGTAWQIGGGISTNISDYVLDFGYRYFDYGNIFPSANDSGLSSENIRAERYGHKIMMNLRLKL